MLFLKIVLYAAIAVTAALLVRDIVRLIKNRKKDGDDTDE